MLAASLSALADERIPPPVTSRPAIDLSRQTVRRRHEPRRIVTCDCAAGDGVAIGDVVVFAADSAAPAVGRVFVRDETHFAAKITGDGRVPSVDEVAVRVPHDVAARLRDRLPYGSTLWARVDRMTPGRSVAWLDAGGWDGLRVDDQLLAVRHGVPIARLRVETVYDGAALATVVALVANAAVAASDDVMLWPSPAERRLGRLRSTVIGAAVDDHEPTLLFPADRSDGVAAGQRWEIRRDGAYIDLVEVAGFRGRFAVAGPSVAFARDRARVGDTAELRGAADALAGRIPARVFRIEDDYCLINAGELDGVRVDMPLAVLRGDREIGRIRVTTVKAEYCGGRIETPAASPERAGPRAEVRVWDAVVGVDHPAVEPPIGVINTVLDEGSTALVRMTNARPPPPVGAIVAVESDPPAAALVIAAGPQHVILYAPRSCRRGGITPGLTVRTGE